MNRLMKRKKKKEKRKKRKEKGGKVLGILSIEMRFFPLMQQPKCEQKLVFINS